MSTDRFSQSNGFGMLDYLRRMYGNEIRKSDFENMGCNGFYYSLLREGIIVMVCDGPDPLVKIGNNYQESDIYLNSLNKKMY
jgi:hypothetical protein